MVKAIIIGIVITIVGLFALSVVDKVASGDALINGQPTTEVVDESKNKVSISGEINHPSRKLLCLPRSNTRFFN